MMIDENISNTTGTIGADESMSITIEKADGGVVVECRLEKLSRDDILIYHIHIAREQYEHCIEVNATTGSIYKYDLRYLPEG